MFDPWIRGLTIGWLMLVVLSVALVLGLDDNRISETRWKTSKEIEAMTIIRDDHLMHSVEVIRTGSFPRQSPLVGRAVTRTVPPDAIIGIEDTQERVQLSEDIDGDHFWLEISGSLLMSTNSEIVLGKPFGVCGKSGCATDLRILEVRAEDGKKFAHVVYEGDTKFEVVAGHLHSPTQLFFVPRAVSAK